MTNIEIEPLADWSEEQRAGLRSLGNAVYHQSESASWPGRFIEWSTPEWGLGITDDDGDLVSFAGLLIRDGHHDQRPVRIGGVGGVKTHPDHRGLGHATAAMKASHRFFIDHGAVDFALLVCNDTLIPYYERLGWEVFEGELVTLQHGEPAVFTFNRVMVTSVTGKAPRHGVIDLNGPPW